MSYENRNRVGANLFGAVSIVLPSGVMALSLLVFTPARAQVVGATLSGTLSDPSGAVVPKAQLEVTNVATGIKTTVATNERGFYTAPNLVPGNYEMTATASGFATEKRTGIILEVGAQHVENITLKVGQTTQQVEVTSAQAPEIELASNTIGAVVGSTDVVELPLNGRSWTDLALLQPGTIGTTTQPALAASSSSRAYKGFGSSTSIGGARPTQNSYRLDGIIVSDFANGPPSDALGETSGVDSIQEFSVLTSAYPAEYGDSSGGVINAITRSGSNKFHGSAYDFLRNSVFDSRNYFDGPTIPPFRRNQFGGSIGGPIRTDRTFFFANYEGLRQLQGVTAVSTVPSAAARAGNICSVPGTPAACTPSTVSVSPAAQVYIPAFPLPNAGLTAQGNEGFYDFAPPEAANDNYLTIRIDQRFSAKDTFDGNFVIDHGGFQSPNSFGTLTLGTTDNYQVYSLEETHIFSANLVNSARVGAFRQFAAANKFASTTSPFIMSTTVGAEPGYTPSQVEITNVSTFSGGSQGTGYTVWGFTNFELFDDLSWVHGTHTIGFGFAGMGQYLNQYQIPIAAIWEFSSVQNFLANVPMLYKAQTTSTVSFERGFRDTMLAGYAQDSWRWRPDLTVNLGLRYEMMTNPTEGHGYWGTLTNLTNPTFQVGNPMFQINPTLKNFEPRVGFVWDPFHNGKTSVRSGFGIGDSEPGPYQTIREITGVGPFANTATVNKPPAGTFYNGENPYLVASTETAEYVEPKPGRTYVMQWNFGLQREIVPNLMATVTYTGSSGVHLPWITDAANGVVPTLTSAGWLYPAPVGAGTLNNPNFSQILANTWWGHANYHAMEAMVTKRVSHGFQIQGSYTWGKSIDNTSSTLGGDFSNANNSAPEWWDPSITRGLSDFNVGQTFVFNAIWQIPEAKSLSGFVGRAVNGWQLGVINKENTGVPFTPNFGTSASTLAGVSTSEYPDRLSGPGCNTAVNKGNYTNYVNYACFSVPTAPSMAYWTANCDTTSKIYGSPATVEPYPICLNLRGNAGRNSLVGPGYSDVDFSVFKNNKIREKYNVQFRAEFFNILNRTNYGIPSGDLYSTAGVVSGTGGDITTLAGQSREIQFALKTTW